MFVEVVTNVKSALCGLPSVQGFLGVDSRSAAALRVHLWDADDTEGADNNPPRLILSLDATTLDWRAGRLSGTCRLPLVVDLVPDESCETLREQAVWFWTQMSLLQADLTRNRNSSGGLLLESLSLEVPGGPILKESVPAGIDLDTWWTAQLMMEVSTS